ncbi:hypothetical protein WME90_01570 [Sorangium sp. So ce375]|uniref:OB-fold protein n=1 Tax=Sorangium sp. So ce375 TaxID=3133306 RepID=UPI003F5BC6C7
MRSWIGISLAVSMFVIGCKGSEQRSEAVGGPSAAPSSPPAATASVVPVARPREASIKVTAQALLDVYRDNEVRADMLYKGKLLYVSGTVQYIGKTDDGSITVAIGEGDVTGGRVSCDVSEAQQQDVAWLNTGKPATLQGRLTWSGTGTFTGRTARLEACEINPVMRLCKRLQPVLGAKGCKVDKETGDAFGLAFDVDSKTGLSAGGLGSSIVCAHPEGDAAAELIYDAAMAELSKKPGLTVIGSRNALCIAAFGNEDKSGKAIPVPDDILDKARAFFASL